MANKTISHLALALQARTNSGNSEPFAFPESFDELNIFTEITAISGTSPALVIEYQFSPDGERWFTYTASPDQTATGKLSQKLTSNIGRLGRIQYWIKGSATSVTFRVDVEGKRRG